MLTHQATALFQSLAWACVLARCVHTYIHTGRNKVEYRATAYFVSWFVLTGMWGYLVVGVAVG